jgi:hypothetical protein
MKIRRFEHTQGWDEVRELLSKKTAAPGHGSTAALQYGGTVAPYNRKTAAPQHGNTAALGDEDA